MSNIEGFRQQIDAAKIEALYARNKESAAKEALKSSNEQVGINDRRLERLHQSLLEEHLKAEKLSVCYFREVPSTHKGDTLKNEHSLSDYLNYTPNKEELKHFGIYPGDETNILFVSAPPRANRLGEDINRELFKEVFDHDYHPLFSYQREWPNYENLLARNDTRLGIAILACPEHTPSKEILDKYPLVLDDGLAVVKPTVAKIIKTDNGFLTESGESFDKQMEAIRSMKEQDSPLVLPGNLYGRASYEDDDDERIGLNRQILNYFGLPPIYY